jgi:hypothetical protein
VALVEYALLIGVAAVLVIALVAAVSSSAAKKKRKVLDALFGKIPDLEPVNESVQGYWAAFAKCYSQGCGQNYIDSTTWNDLDMDSVFSRINRCLSSVGEEYLFAMLHILANNDVLQKRERLVAAFGDKELRLNAQVALDKLGKNRFNGLWLLMFAPNVLSIGNYKRYLAQALLPLLGVALLFLNTILGVVVIVLALIANITTFEIIKAKSERWLEHISYFTKTLRCAKRLEKVLGESHAEHSEALTAALSNLKSLKFSSFMIAVEPNSDADMLMSLIGMLSLTPVIQYSKSVQILANKQKELQELFALVGEVDAALSIASFRASLDYYVLPTFDDSLAIKGQSVFHPLLKTPVPNDVDVTKNLLLTGSNASGKSTYIKAIALNAIFAQTLNTCCATAFTIKPAPIITSMGVADNIVGGESYFVVEIKSMRRIVYAASDELEFYCFIDEILKGTNTVERIAASASVLQFLHQQNCICVAATHDLELTEILRTQYLNNHFSEQITSAGMLFDYKLKAGPSQSKNAIKLLAFFDYPEAVVNNANELAQTIDAKKHDRNALNFN